MGSAHVSFVLLMFVSYAKNSKIMYKTQRTDNTIIREEIRQHENDAI